VHLLFSAVRKPRGFLAIPNCYVPDDARPRANLAVSRGISHGLSSANRAFLLHQPTPTAAVCTLHGDSRGLVAHALLSRKPAVARRRCRLHCCIPFRRRHAICSTAAEHQRTSFGHGGKLHLCSGQPSLCRNPNVEFVTLKFVNDPQGIRSKNVAAVQLSHEGWRLVSEQIEQGKFRGGRACCLSTACCLPAGAMAGRTPGFIVVTFSREQIPAGIPYETPEQIQQRFREPIGGDDLVKGVDEMAERAVAWWKAAPNSHRIAVSVVLASALVVLLAYVGVFDSGPTPGNTPAEVRTGPPVKPTVSSKTKRRTITGAKGGASTSREQQAQPPRSLRSQMRK